MVQARASEGWQLAQASKSPQRLALREEEKLPIVPGSIRAGLTRQVRGKICTALQGVNSLFQPRISGAKIQTRDQQAGDYDENQDFHTLLERTMPAITPSLVLLGLGVGESNVPYINCAAMYNLCMPLLSDAERRFLSAVSKLAYSNPFLPERLEHERAALGKHYVPGQAAWSASVDNPDAVSPNVRTSTRQKLSLLIEKVRSRLEAGLDTSSEDLAIYEDGAHYFLYQQYHPDL